MVVSRTAVDATYDIENLRRVLNFLALLTFVGIGGLQMYRVALGWVASYGADILVPSLLYFWFRQGTTIVNRDRPLGARQGNYGIAEILWQYWYAVLFIVYVVELLVRRWREPEGMKS